ncbi:MULTISPECIES: retroviral-like aspartic protease family protein [Sphingomonas]|uniref:retroviral-like aspartic protease family protein n=1 Tax=Sphingomonas TaxID=13687 RepID=UPI000DEF8DAF|nr:MULTISPECIES: retroviral-like aspartic protease family protein [Sphingomonas]
MRTVPFVPLVLTLFACPAAAQITHVEAVNGAAQVDSSTQTTDAKMGRDASDRMTVAVRVAGSGPYQFIVDTGADRTVVARELADRLRLPSGPTATLHSISGVDSIHTARVDRLEYTAKRVDGIDAAVLEGINIGADGILGTDSLRAQRVQFDFKAKTLSITSARQAPPDDPGTVVVQGRRQAGRLILTNALASGHGVSVVVDTGSDLNIGNPAMEAMLRRKGLLAGDSQIELTSVTGAKLTGSYTFLRELVLGGVTLTNVAVVFADAHTFHQLKLDDKPAMLLGMNAIRAFDKVSIDFAGRKLRVLLPKGSERDSPAQLASR